MPCCLDDCQPNVGRDHPEVKCPTCLSCRYVITTSLQCGERREVKSATNHFLNPPGWDMDTTISAATSKLTGIRKGGCTIWEAFTDPAKTTFRKEWGKTGKTTKTKHRSRQENVNSHCQPWAGVHYLIALLQLWLIIIFVPLSGPLIFISWDMWTPSTGVLHRHQVPMWRDKRVLKFAPEATGNTVRLAPRQGRLWVSGKSWRQKSNELSWSLLASPETDGKSGTPRSASAKPVSRGNASDNRSLNSGEFGHTETKWRRAKQTEIAQRGFMCQPYAEL